VCLPESLKDPAFAQIFKAEEAVQRWLALLIKNIDDGFPTQPSAGVDSDFQPQSEQPQQQPQQQQSSGVGQVRMQQYVPLPSLPMVPNTNGNGVGQRTGATWGI